MSDPFVGEIKMFAGDFAPRGWAFCDGQLLAVSQNDALFSLLGTIYGGDGRTTFALPDLRSRIPIHAGQGPGLSHQQLGRRGGTETVALISQQLPSHNHAFDASLSAATSETPHNMFVSSVATDSGPSPEYLASQAPTTAFSSQSIGNAGGGQAHLNLQPTLCINYIISLFGIYPSRS